LYGLYYSCRFTGGRGKELNRFNGGNRRGGYKRYLFDRRRTRRTLGLSTPIRGNKRSRVETYRYKELKGVTTRSRQFGKFEM